MKKTAIITLFILLTSAAFINAQSVKVGAGIVYGSEIENIGFRADGVYSLNKDYSAEASLTYFAEKDYLSWFVLDLNGQYNFIKKDDLTVYGLAGLNMTFWSIKIPSVNLGYGVSTEEMEESGTDTGINVGAGARKKISEKLELFGDVKYVLGGSKFFSIGAGILFSLD